MVIWRPDIGRNAHLSPPWDCMKDSPPSAPSITCSTSSASTGGAPCASSLRRREAGAGA